MYAEERKRRKDAQSARAVQRYNSCYNNVLFIGATSGKSSTYANRLIDDALALCGDPYYFFPPSRRYCAAAWRFLDLFVGFRLVNMAIGETLVYRGHAVKCVGISQYSLDDSSPMPYSATARALLCRRLTP